MYRKTAHAGLFYPRSPQQCQELLQDCLQDVRRQQPLPSTSAAGIVPHAGWVYSGKTAAAVFEAIRRYWTPSTFIVFGAVHVPGVSKATVWCDGKWQTPLGDVVVNSELAQALVARDESLMSADYAPHAHEHSIEVEVPFIKYLFPDAEIVPVMIPPQRWAAKIGEYAAALCGDTVVALGSTDLTHYGSRFGFTPAGTGEKALKWVKEENDRRMIDLMLDLRSDSVVDEAHAHHNACGAGAIAATLAFAKDRKKERGRLLDYTTSWDVFPEREIDSFVGYSGVLY